MKTDVFNARMDLLKTSFGEKMFDLARSAFIWKFCQTLTDDEFTKITDHFLSSMHRAPLPSDFQQAANQEIRSRRNAHVDSDFTEILCRKCQDFGFLQISEKNRSLDQFKIYCCCSCQRGLKVFGDERGTIPILSPAIESMFNHAAVSFKEFAPEDTSGIFEKESFVLTRSLLNKMQYWKGQKEMSAGFWSDFKH